LEDQSLSIDESALTGESLPADKEGGQPAYSGTVVKQGNGMAVVTATGRDTKFARTIELVESAEEVSHFRRAVMRIGYFLIISAACLVVLVITAALIRGDPWMEVILFAMVLIIAGIPAALPAVLSVTMSIGAGRLARWKAIVSKLTSMEEMAGLELLCADKTGTLTKNELELQEPVTISASDQQDLLLAAALTTQRNADDPIDKAILGGFKDTDQLESFTVFDFKPFDPNRKRADAEVEKDGRRLTVSKGAPQVITDLVQPEESVRNRIDDQVDELGRKGFRCLGVARKEQGGDWEFLGLLPLFDPPREDSAEVIHTAIHDYNIDIRMITGDHPAIGRQVAEQIGMGTDIRLASDVFPENGGIETKSGEERQKLLKQVLVADGFAEVTPENKFQIIKWFQEGDRIVGMTGDGVNDAPALKQADVGIAVVGATDAARSAADLVLTEKGLGVITRAIAESRRIFKRMTSYATYRITETIRLLLFIAFSILIFNYYPVTAIMIVLLAILNDIPILAIAWDNAETPVRPVRWNMTRVITLAAVLGVGGVIASFGLFWFITQYMGLPDAIVQTMMFLKLLVAGHLTIYLTRNRGWFWSRPWPSLGLFLTLEGTQILGTLVAVYGWLMHPIGWFYALGVWGYTFVWFFILAAAKVLTVKILDRLGHHA
jgi:H+-transporting ATPase